MTKTNLLSTGNYKAARGVVMYAPGYNQESMFAALSQSEFYELL